MWKNRLLTALKKLFRVTLVVFLFVWLCGLLVATIAGFKPFIGGLLGYNTFEIMSVVNLVAGGVGTYCLIELLIGAVNKV